MWGEPSNGERIKVQKIIFKEGGSEVCPWTMLKQWFPKWSVFTQRGTIHSKGENIFPSINKMKKNEKQCLSHLSSFFNLYFCICFIVYIIY